MYRGRRVHDRKAWELPLNIAALTFIMRLLVQPRRAALRTLMPLLNRPFFRNFDFSVKSSGLLLLRP
jgi:hypothetical protein